MTLVVDPIRHEMIWLLENRFSLRRQLPTTFIGKPLWFFCSLHDLND